MVLIALLRVMRIFRIFWIFKNFNLLSINTVIGKLQVMHVIRAHARSSEQLRSSLSFSRSHSGACALTSLIRQYALIMLCVCDSCSTSYWACFGSSAYSNCSSSSSSWDISPAVSSTCSEAVCTGVPQVRCFNE